MAIVGARIVVESLIKEGVEVLFGYPGGAVLPIFNELYNTKEIKFVLVRHEQAAGHAADGYARVSGKVGVCITTSGPGATNLVTAIATAYMDSIPIVALTGQVPTYMIGNDAFQEADIIGITRPIVKHSFLVTSTDQLPNVIKEAFYIARTGKPGPVVVDLPRDVTSGCVEKYTYPESVNIRGYKPKYHGHLLQIKKAAQLISESKKPIIYIGGGIILSNACEEFFEFVEKTRIPVTCTLLGLGGFPSSHPLFLGMLGMHGTKYANLAITNCDLIIAIGARFDDRATGKLDEFAPNAKIIHIDIDPTSISKNVKVDVPVVADAKLALKELNKIVVAPKIDEWREEIALLKEKYPLRYIQDDTLRPQYIVECISDLTKGNAVICTEVGQNQMWTAQYYKFSKPRTLLSSGGLGTMGYGFPASIGAAMYVKDMPIIDIAGDGSFQMNIQELATAVYYKLPIKVIILNNSYLGMVRQWQELFYNKRYCATFITGPDFVKLAQAYGAIGYCVEKKQDLLPTLQKALKEDSLPVIVDCKIPPEENVYPMVPAGASLTQMIDGMA